MTDNLVRRGRNFSARLFIPVEFQETVGRAEIVRSLKTKDKRQAIVLLRKLQDGIQSLFFMVRAGMINRSQLTAILLNFVDNVLSDLRKSGNDPLPHEDDTLYETSARTYLTKVDCYGGLTLPEQYRKLADEARNDFFIKKNMKFVAGFVKDLLDENRIVIDPESPDFAKFTNDFAYVYILAMQETANRLEGNKDFSCREKVLEHVAEVCPITLKQAVEEWLQAKASSGRVKMEKGKTYEQYVIVLDGFRKFYGDDYAVRKLNNSELQKFVTDQQKNNVKNVTIEKRIRILIDVLKLASVNYGILQHPYKIELKSDAANIQPLTVAELNGLFLCIGDRKKTEKWQFWATLVALTCGLRAGEVVGLGIDDVRLDDDGVWFIAVRDAKTKAGIRDVPLPSILLDFGFLNFRNDMNQLQHPFLFMDYHVNNGFIKIDQKKFSAWFYNLKKKFVEKNSTARLHGLRHNFVNALKQGGVSSEMRCDLAGHEHNSRSAHNKYTEVFELKQKKRDIDKAHWECDFSLLDAWHIHSQSSQNTPHPTTKGTLLE